MTITAGLFTSASVEWATPQSFFDDLSREFGGFLLDVCATSRNAKCEAYYTRQEDGLSREWTRRNWMNPPYGREIGLWVRRAHEEALRGNQTVALLPARTDTRWFHQFIYGRHKIRLVRGRLKFNDGRTPAPFPSMIVIFGPPSDVDGVQRRTGRQGTPHGVQEPLFR
jgi:site-specific DNA-methyltransferase (adenine-specific)